MSNIKRPAQKRSARSLPPKPASRTGANGPQEPEINSGTTAMNTPPTKSKATQDAVDGFHEPDIAVLSMLYQSEPCTLALKQELVEQARVELGKYDLSPELLNEASPMLACALQMLAEQHGGKAIPAEEKVKIEQHILQWCGYDREETAS